MKSFLEKYGDDVTAHDEESFTLLHKAIIGIGKWDIKVPRFLINKDADVNAKNNHGLTPLFYAILTENIEIVNFLITNNADVTTTIECGCTPLHWAACTKAVIVKLLISKGANTDGKCKYDGTSLDIARTQKTRK